MGERGSERECDSYILSQHRAVAGHSDLLSVWKQE